MRARPTRVLAAALALPLAAAAVTALLGAMPSVAVPAPVPTNVGSGPVTVIIPGNATPAATPGSDGGNGSGGGNGNGGGDDGDGGGGGEGGGQTCTTAPDGSPVPASSAQDDVPHLKLSAKSAAASEWLIATGSGFRAGEQSQLVLYPGAVVIDSFVAANDGSVTAQFRIPEKTRTGGATVEMTGWESCHIANADLRIVGSSLAASWLSVWWVYLVLGILAFALVSLAIAFRRQLGGLSTPGPRGAEA